MLLERGVDLGNMPRKKAYSAQVSTLSRTATSTNRRSSRTRTLQMNGEPPGSPVHVVANGSTGARNSRLPPGERNTYCLFRLATDELEMWIRELRLDGVVGAELFRGKLDSSPTLP
jgi:hypothetical protein